MVETKKDYPQPSAAMVLPISVFLIPPLIQVVRVYVELEAYLATPAPLVAKEAPAVLPMSTAWRSRQRSSHPHPLRDIVSRTAVVIPHPVQQQQLAIFIQQAVRTHLVIV